MDENGQDHTRTPLPAPWTWDAEHPCWAEVDTAWIRIDPTGSLATSYRAVSPAVVRAVVTEARRLGLPGWAVEASTSAPPPPQPPAPVGEPCPRTPEPGEATR